MTEENIFKLLQLVLSESSTEENIVFCQEVLDSDDWFETYSFFNDHAIAPLTSSLIKYLPDNCSELKKSWRESVYSNVYSYSQIIKCQNYILESFHQNNILAVVLKGTSAAKYYPNPPLRTMGDVDLLVKPEDYDLAAQCLVDIGSIETTCQIEIDMDRHRSFQFEGVLIELHSRFALYMDEKQAERLDNMLFSCMSNSEVLPEEENGLVLLTHIQQHMKSGIGLRQIIDWMMFVRSYLDDSKWSSSFQTKVKLLELETLAMVSTKMCQRYLGLNADNLTWCEGANDEVCENLMKYIFECGNFGRRREKIHAGNTKKVPSIKHPLQLLRYLQDHGKENWQLLDEYPCLKPFAGLYQSCRYLLMLNRNKIGIVKWINIRKKGREQAKLFSAIGLK